MTTRRDFLKNTSLAAAGLALSTTPLTALAPEKMTQLTILHTNDVHSRIEPFPLTAGKRAGLGGAARRAALIDSIRAEGNEVLLLDCGDIFQGTPYFNFFGGELEFKLMTDMGYDAATLGNHDFDAGITGLVEQLPHANFPFINCNYDFSKTTMAGRTMPYKVIKKGKLKIGVLGVGVELDGLVPEILYKGTQYLDPIEQANKAARTLKESEGCHYVICLSHLGYSYDSDKPSDKSLAAASRDIDLILGGHTHTFLDEPTQIKNRDGQTVLVSQAGWAGIVLGRIDIFFDSCGCQKIKKGTCENLVVGKTQKI